MEVHLFEDSEPSGDMDFLNLFSHIAENIDLAKVMLIPHTAHITSDHFHQNISRKIKRHFSGGRRG